MSAIRDLIKRKQKFLSAQRGPSALKWNIEEYLFSQQLSFVRDEARMAMAVCSVRAGKTEACAADLIDTAIKFPSTNQYYITLARSSAERIVWPTLKKINRTYGFNAFPNEAKLTLKFPNGSTIYLMGANDESEIEKIRGVSDVALIYLDEAQAFREHIKGLIDDIVVKRLYDLNGRCRMIGTPGPVLSGYFYECSQSSGWAHHHWTMFDNPWLFKKSGKTPQELTAADCERAGVTIDHPSIQRENYGRWVHDPSSLLLQYNANLNHYESLPEDRYTYILGIDLGTKDADALCLLAYSPSSPITWLVEELVTPNQKTDDLAVQIRGLQSKYGDMMMIADTGGLGLKVCEDLTYRYGFVIQAADKKGKMADYRFLNNALRTGLFKAPKASRFARDCGILHRDNDKSTPDRIVVKGHSDAVDAALYAFGESPAYDYKPAKFKALPGTIEYIREQEGLHKEALVERIKRDQAMKDGGAVGHFQKDNQGMDPWHSWD